jgi:hypothetical protein
MRTWLQTLKRSCFQTCISQCTLLHFTMHTVLGRQQVHRHNHICSKVPSRLLRPGNFQGNLQGSLREGLLQSTVEAPQHQDWYYSYLHFYCCTNYCYHSQPQNLHLLHHNHTANCILQNKFRHNWNPTCYCQKYLHKLHHPAPGMQQCLAQ